MQQFIGGIPRSSLFKVAGIAVMILVMLVPLSMTRSVINDRQMVNVYAHRDIASAWGQPQVLGGPVLVVPYEISGLPSYGDRSDEKGKIYFLPRTLAISADVATIVRKRGLHKVPVYTANVEISGSFEGLSIDGLGLEQASISWSRAYFALPVADRTAIRNSPEFVAGDRSSAFESGGAAIAGMPSQIIAPAGDIVAAATTGTPFDFSINVQMGGTDSLKFLPLGDSTTVTVDSSWSSPAFVGTHLPENHELTDSGFSANWRIGNLGRSYPSRWVDNQAEHDVHSGATFGVNMFMPIGIYQMTDRASKYAVLFIGLTFVTFFLFEVLQNLRLHPLQYILVGFANLLFFLLLLSLAEHIGFAIAYFVSAFASTALVAAYSASILASRRRASLVVVMLSVLYGFLYLTLRAESYAMLAGTIALWFSLGLIMYLTRHIDWYRWGATDDLAGNEANATRPA